jgi:hypothetical protein
MNERALFYKEMYSTLYTAQNPNLRTQGRFGVNITGNVVSYRDGELVPSALY